jgi:hypothetical protein
LRIASLSLPKVHHVEYDGDVLVDDQVGHHRARRRLQRHVRMLAAED